jgi:DNA-binding CsgD family transcriptional regulator
MRNRDALLDRDEALDRVDSVLVDAARGRGRVLLVHGDAGIGKTALLAAATAEAEHQGFRTLSARAGVLERSLGHGVARELFEAAVLRAPAARRRALLAGPAAIAEAALGGGEVAGGVSEPQVHHGLYWLAANLAEREPLLIVVDDAQWCDEATVRWLLYLARRLDEVAIAVLVAVRRGEPDAPGAILDLIAAEPVVEVLELPPLGGPATTELLARVSGRPVGPEFARACRDWTGGNPFMVGELARELTAEGIAPTGEAVERMRGLTPGAVSRSVLLRLSRLPRATAGLASAAAVLGSGAELRHAAALAELAEGDAHDAADALAEAKILEPGQPLRFVHPLLESVIYQDLPAARLALDHRRAARILAEDGASDRAAVHLLRCEPAGDSWVADQLRAAAARDVGRGAPDAAVTVLERAVAEPVVAADRPALLHELGRLQARVRQPGAIASLAEALSLATDPALRAQIAEDLAGVQVLAGGWDDAIATLEAALSELANGDGDVATRLETMMAAVTAYDPRIVAQFNARWDRLLELARAGGTAARPLMLLMASVSLFRGTGQGDMADLLERGLDHGRFVGSDGAELWVGQAIHAYVALDDLERAGRLAEAVWRDGSRRGSVAGVSAGSSCRGWVYSQEGDLVRAEAELRGGFDLAREHDLVFAIPSIVRYCIDLLTERPGLADIAALLEQLQLPEAFMATASGSFVLETRARVRLARGDIAAAIEDLRRCGEIFDALDLRSPMLTTWRSTAAVALRDRDGTEAARLVAEELDTARAIGMPRAIGVALRARGLVEGGEAGRRLLAEAADVLAGSPSRLEHARALVELGAALRRANQRAGARDPLRDGLELAERCGATALAERARTELLATGARPRRALRTGIDALTPSELRVCRMAAGGASNPEIAQALFVTRATVESQLHAAYLKLDISSRRELADLIKDP